ncbi:MAG: BREX system ATP-binding domain-containing protein [Anaerolineales bacterium]|nr:BREX system ATP-binding domain-containing protein [Anaerolineales bacterium]
MPQEDRIQIYLLGRFLVTRGDARVVPSDWSRRKAAALLQRVAVEGRLLKEEAVEFLWPDLDPDAGANNLYRTLHSLRKTLNEQLGEGAAEQTIEYESGVLSLPDAVWVDVHAFKSAAQEQDPVSLKEAITFYEGELLPNARYADWTQPHRQSLQHLYREASLALAEHHVSQGEHAAAIEFLSPLLQKDPADEVVHRELMRCYANVGRRHDALRQYQTCIQRLREDVGVDPSPSTRDLYQEILEGRYPSEPIEPRPGGEEPLQVLPADLISSSPLVGREEELSKLRQALESAAEGRGGTRFIEGFAGIGKTHLAQAVLDEAQEQGFRVLMGGAHEEEGQLPYQPFVEAFDRWAGKTGGSTSHPLSSADPASAGEERQDALSLYRSAAAYLAEGEEKRPFVLLIDDLHEADEGTLQLFHYLARQMPNRRGLLLATFRSGGAESGSMFAALLNSLYRERLGERLKLSPLERGQVLRILEAELDGTPSGELVQAVHEISEGNPFFALEITRALRAEGGFTAHEGKVTLRDKGLLAQTPHELLTLLKDRVRDLGDPVEETLNGAAVLGREFSFELLQDVIGLSDLELLDALDVALDSELVQESEVGYRFRHGLIRRALYDSLSRARRRVLHRWAGDALEALPTDQQQTALAHVERLAHHFSHSDQRRRAIDYLIQAGHKAAGMYAFELAVEHLEHALELMEELDVSDPEKRFDLLVSIEGYHGLLADTPQAVEAGRRALQVRGDDWEPAPEQRALVHRQAAIRLITSGQLDQAETELEDALEELEGRPESLEHARVLYNLAQLRWHQNRYSEAFEIAERSLGVAESLEDREAIARAYEMLALACHSLGEWKQGMDFEQRRESLTGTDIDVDSAFDVHL